MTSSVLWQQSIRALLNNGVTTFVEVGPGRVLSGLIRRTDKTSNVLNVEDDKSLTSAVALLG